MMINRTITDYWFTIEPYVYVSLNKKCVLLYNTLDGAVVESEKSEIIELLQELLQKENHGITLLSDKKLQNESFNAFIMELREKYMGDIIDVRLSKGKPIQLLPFFDFQDSDMSAMYKRHNFSVYRNVLDKLSEISIHLNTNTNETKLLSFLQSVPDNFLFNIIGCFEEIVDYDKILSFLNLCSSPKVIITSYKGISPLLLTYSNNFSYSIVVDFPLDRQLWRRSREILLNQTLSFEYIFNVSSLSDCEESELLIEQFKIANYQLKPIYTGANIDFFRENIYLSKDDILSACISIKDIFANQSINTHDFGKINVMPNGDVFSNLNYPSLGNIYADSLYDLVEKEITEGSSWLRIRNQSPCNGCVYQWLCPSPSDYEIAIGCSNLCHLTQSRI